MLQTFIECIHIQKRGNIYFNEYFVCILSVLYNVMLSSIVVDSIVWLFDIFISINTFIQYLFLMTFLYSGWARHRNTALVGIKITKIIIVIIWIVKILRRIVPLHYPIHQLTNCNYIISYIFVIHSNRKLFERNHVI